MGGNRRRRSTFYTSTLPKTTSMTRLGHRLLACIYATAASWLLQSSSLPVDLVVSGGPMSSVRTVIFDTISFGSVKCLWWSSVSVPGIQKAMKIEDTWRAKSAYYLVFKDALVLGTSKEQRILDKANNDEAFTTVVKNSTNLAEFTVGQVQWDGSLKSLALDSASCLWVSRLPLVDYEFNKYKLVDEDLLEYYWVTAFGLVESANEDATQLPFVSGQFTQEIIADWFDDGQYPPKRKVIAATEKESSGEEVSGVGSGRKKLRRSRRTSGKKAAKSNAQTINAGDDDSESDDQSPATPEAKDAHQSRTSKITSHSSSKGVPSRTDNLFTPLAEKPASQPASFRGDASSPLFGKQSKASMHFGTSPHSPTIDLTVDGPATKSAITRSAAALDDLSPGSHSKRRKFEPVRRRFTSPNAANPTGEDLTSVRETSPHAGSLFTGHPTRSSVREFLFDEETTHNPEPLLRQPPAEASNSTAGGLVLDGREVFDSLPKDVKDMFEDAFGAKLEVPKRDYFPHSISPKKHFLSGFKMPDTSDAQAPDSAASPDIVVSTIYDSVAGLNASARHHVGLINTLQENRMMQQRAAAGHEAAALHCLRQVRQLDNQLHMTLDHDPIRASFQKLLTTTIRLASQNPEAAASGFRNCLPGIKKVVNEHGLSHGSMPKLQEGLLSDEPGYRGMDIMHELGVDNKHADFFYPVIPPTRVQPDQLFTKNELDQAVRQREVELLMGRDAAIKEAVQRAKTEMSAQVAASRPGAASRQVEIPIATDNSMQIDQVPATPKQELAKWQNKTPNFE